MKKLLIVVDYQNDFVSGSLGFEKAKSLEQNIVDKIIKYKQNGDDVAFTLDTHEECYLDTKEGRNLPIVHCVKDSDGWQLFGKVKALCDENTPVFVKQCFGSGKLFEYLSNNNEYESVELVGVVTNICVISNAILVQTALPETAVTVDSSCCASNDDDFHQMALDIMKNLHIAIV